MEGIIDDLVPPEDLKKFEKIYTEQVLSGKVQTQSQFEYAWCLVRSKYPADIKKGLALLEDLYFHGDEKAKRDYIFYLAIGHTRLKNYAEALKHVRGLIQVEPLNSQARDLERVINKRMKNEGLVGMAVVGGAVLALGGLVGLGIALSKK